MSRAAPGGISRSTSERRVGLNYFERRRPCEAAAAGLLYTAAVRVNLRSAAVREASAAGLNLNQNQNQVLRLVRDTAALSK